MSVSSPGSNIGGKEGEERTACPPWHRGRARRRSSGSSSCGVPVANSGQPCTVRDWRARGTDLSALVSDWARVSAYARRAAGGGRSAQLNRLDSDNGLTLEIHLCIGDWTSRRRRERANFRSLSTRATLGAMPTASRATPSKLHTLCSLLSLLLLASTSTLASSSTSSRSTNLFKRLRGSQIAPGVSPAGDDYWCRVEGECLPCPPGAVSPLPTVKNANHY